MRLSGVLLILPLLPAPQTGVYRLAISRLCYTKLIQPSWVYPTEVFPLATRAKGAALATVAFSVAGGVINEIIPYLISAVKFWTFIIFALINLVMLVPIYLFYIGMSRVFYLSTRMPKAYES